MEQRVVQICMEMMTRLRCRIESSQQGSAPEDRTLSLATSASLQLPTQHMQLRLSKLMR